MSMDDLPASLVLEILSRLTDSTDLARCRLVSKTLNSLSYGVRSINLLCSMSRYSKSRSPETKSSVTPFKAVFKNLVHLCTNLEYVHVGVDKSLCGISFDDVEDESDDLYLTDLCFMKEWLPGIAKELKSLCISDFWVQSCWRRSEALSLISTSCHRLVKLVVKNAWLSVDGLHPMAALTSLTLEFVRLDDEDLNQINNCFTSLTELNLIGVGGLKEPKIKILHLRSCRWSVSNAPLSLTICAPNLVDFQLKCIKPRLIVLEAPALCAFDLSLEGTDEFKFRECPSLEFLQLESFNLGGLFSIFRCCETIRRLKVDSFRRPRNVGKIRFGLDMLFDYFPNISHLNLGPASWHEMETCFCAGGFKDGIEMKMLKEFVGHIVVYEIELTLTFIFCILEKCSRLSDVSLMIHHDVDSFVAGNLISKCRSNFPKVRWRWGIWKEGTKDTWVSDCI